GIPAFSFEEIRHFFSSSAENILKNELYRQSVQKRILPVYRGFYVIIPPQYAAKNIVPPVYYIERLMTFLKKPYYICLLNAAELLGAAHQRPQKFAVMTAFPKSSTSETKNNLLEWLYRKTIPEKFLKTKNSETGVITFSNPELTAIDLVQYEQYAGGLARVATILEELIEQTDFSKAADGLFDTTTIPTIQRLGFILENVLNEREQADILYQQLKMYGKRLNYVPLSSRHQSQENNKDSRWKIYVNTDIEADEL
ncbi:MAG: type IV toxin-antitoxin system AbiEi family antitoxin, partial [Candidatus Azobacteroides sp.]|nr:type IV toxin-antitoxin system AbiEi family antitoxin [Candidatus Azobacteroides sp.]